MMQSGYIRSIWIKLYSTGVTVIASFLMVYYYWFHRKELRSKGDDLFLWWSIKCINIIGLSYEIEEKSPLILEQGQPYIIMCNHSSFYDIPLSIVAIKGSVRMMAKTELFRIPIWGRGLKAGEFIPVSRKGTPKELVAQMKYARDKMQSGIMLWVAPEGTRSVDGQLGELKKGGFWLAKRMKAKIIPICLKNTYSLYNSRSKKFLLNQLVKIRVGDTIDSAHYQSDEQGLMAAVRSQLQ